MFYVSILLAVLSSAASQEINGRIVGGSNAILGRNPYQVSLQNNIYHHSCGGAIISSRWVLTASHCADNYPTYVKVGSTTVGPPGTRYEVAVSVRHLLFPLFYQLFDIGLVKTKKDIEFGPNVQPIAMATQDIPDGTVLTVTGWGALNNPNAVFPNDLQTLDMQKVNQQVCKAKMNTSFIDDSMLCLLKGVGQGVCAGDSGSPAVYNNTLYGIVSFGMACARGYPDVFTRVSSYGFWIWFHQLIYSWA